MNYSDDVKQQAVKIFAEHYVNHLMPQKREASARLASASPDARVRLKIGR